MQVQQCERSRALVVLVSIFIRYVQSLASVQRVPESTRIDELASEELYITCSFILDLDIFEKKNTAHFSI